MIVHRVLGLALVSAAACVAVASAAQSDNAASPPGRDLFVERCGACHLEEGFGTRVLARRLPEGQAELEKREALPAALTIAVVRRGMGSMPQIRPAELEDAQLAAIARYLDTDR